MEAWAAKEEDFTAARPAAEEYGDVRLRLQIGFIHIVAATLQAYLRVPSFVAEEFDTVSEPPGPDDEEQLAKHTAAIQSYQLEFPNMEACKKLLLANMRYSNFIQC